MNGRSFQTLIELTPGVVLTASKIRQRAIQYQRTARRLELLDSGRCEREHRYQDDHRPGMALQARGSFSVMGARTA